MHPHTTQTNEALNNSQAGLTPKSKSFHESKSFHYRHAIVIGTHNWGFRKYWSVVFNTLGVEYTQSFVNHLEMTDKRKLYWKTHHSKQEVKRRRGYKQDATQKSYYTRIGQQSMHLELASILDTTYLREHQGQNQQQRGLRECSVNVAQQPI